MRYYGLAKPLLFRIDPEKAHALGMAFLRLLPSMEAETPSLETETAFGALRNPVGLGAGFDKTGEHLGVLEKLGFGYLVAGTVTLDPLPGHPKPRIARNTEEKTMVNALGFPNPGVQRFIENLKRHSLKVPVLGSISGKEVESILKCYESLQPHVAGVELNLSSPNTARLKDLREPKALEELAGGMRPLRRKPTYLKVPPFTSEEQFSKVLEMVEVWSGLGFDGVTAANAVPVSEPRVSTGSGGFSGPPLFPNLVQAVRAIRKRVTKEFEVNAIGGISTAGNVRTALGEGANTVQIHTGVVFEGPGLIRRILTELDA